MDGPALMAGAFALSALTVEVAGAEAAVGVAAFAMSADDDGAGTAIPLRVGWMVYGEAA